jgi:hypothetical protein
LIAEGHLTEGARQKIKTILPKNGTLAGASTWPDRVGRRIPLWNPLHYVQVPRGAASYDNDRDCPQSNCIDASGCFPLVKPTGLWTKIGEIDRRRNVRIQRLRALIIEAAEELRASGAAEKADTLLDAVAKSESESD